MKKGLLFMMLLFCGLLLQAQSSSTHRVVDVDGKTLPGVTIRVEGTFTGQVTDAAGRFTLPQTAGDNQVIELSYVGYQTRKLRAGRLPETIVLYPAVQKLGGVVVTATRSRREVTDVPFRVDVLSRENIEAIPALSVDDYLRAIPGISVSRGASFLGSGNVSMRGMGNEEGRTLVMVDGIPVNKSDGGSVNWNAISAQDIWRIEVMKGPGSSIHGGNAMGGVINLITATPTEPVEGKFSQTFGTFNTSNTHASLSGRNNNFFWNLNGRYRLSDGYITATVEDLDEFSVASFMDEYQAGGRAGYFLSPSHMVEVSGGYYSGKRGTGSSFSGYGFENDHLAAPDGAYNQYTNLTGRVMYRGEFSNESQLNVSFFSHRENYQNIRESVRKEVFSRYDVESIRDDYGFLSSFTMKPHRSHTLTGGIDLRHGSVDGADIYLTSTDKVLNLGKMNQLGIYLQDEIRLGQSPVSLLAAIRFDQANFYDGGFLIEDPTSETSFMNSFAGHLEDASFSAISPRVSVQYHIPASYRIYAGYSKGFRAPVLDDMCRTGRISGGMKLANPNLKPEYLDNVEAGADIFLFEKLTLSPAVYFASGKDYHSYIATGDSLMMNNRMRPIRIKDNIGQVAIMGTELALRYAMAPGLYWSLAYSHINTEIREFNVFDPAKDESLTGRELVYQPRDLFQASMSWKNPYVNLFVAYHYKGAQWMNDVNTEEIEAFNYADLHLWRDLYRGLSLGFTVHNLFNQEMIDSRNMVSPGRMMNIELKYAF